MNKKIKQLRIEHGYKQSDIAKILQISQQSYSRYETGDATLPAWIVRELCEFYAVSADDFLELSN